MNEGDEKLAVLMKTLAAALKVVGAKFREVDVLSAAGTEMAQTMATRCNESPDLPAIPEADDVVLAFQGYRDASQKLHTSFIRLIDRVEFLTDEILNGGEFPSSND